MSIAVCEVVQLVGVGWTPTLDVAAVRGLNRPGLLSTARPVPQLGIAMPALVPPLVAA